MRLSSVELGQLHAIGLYVTSILGLQTACTLIEKTFLLRKIFPPREDISMCVHLMHPVTLGNPVMGLNCCLTS